jgi:hypothetical protein
MPDGRPGCGEIIQPRSGLQPFLQVSELFGVAPIPLSYLTRSLGHDGQDFPHFFGLVPGRNVLRAEPTSVTSFPGAARFL